MKPRRLFSPLILWLCFILSACSGPGVPLSVPEVTLSPLSATPLPSSSSIPATRMPSTTPSIPPYVNQIVEQAKWGNGAITGSEFSPDGKRLGVFTTLGIYIYDAENLKQLDFIPGGPSAAFSPDWSLLAMGSGSTVTLLHLADKTEVTHLETEQGGVARLLFSPDGRNLVSLVSPPGEDVYTQILDLWGVSDGKLLGTWEAGAMPDLAFTPDSKIIYAWNPVRMAGISRWQIPSGSPLPVLEDPPPSTLAFSPDGRLMVSAGLTTGNTDILIQRISGGAQIRKLTWDHGYIVKLLFSPDGSLLAAFSVDGFVKVWRIADWSLLQSFDAGSAESQFLAISPNDQTLVLPTADGLVFYSLTDGQIVRRLRGHFNGIIQAALSPRGDRVAALISGAGPETSSLEVWTFPEGQRMYLLSGVGALKFAWSPDGDRLALADWDGKIRILRSADGTVVQTLPGHSIQVQSVAWSPDGTKIASSSMQSVKIWRGTDGTLLNDLSVSGGWVDSLRFSPDGKLLAGQSWGESEKIEVWQTSDGQSIAEFPSSAFGDSNVIEFAPDGSFLAVAEQSRISLWHLNEDQPFQQLPISEAEVITLRISPDGSLLACGLTNGTIQLWQIPEGRLLRTLMSGNEGISSLDFSNDGKTLLSASRDGTIRFWGIQK